MKPLFLLGGTFDPIHNGHVRLALEVRDTFPWAEIALLPCGVPGHRALPHASSWQRLAMIRRALESVRGVSVLLHELQDGQPQFSVDTARQLRAIWPTRSIAWIVGSDAAESLPSWKEADKLPSLIHLLVATRPGYRGQSPEGFTRSPVEALKHQANGLTAHVEIPLLDISSSLIRQKLSRGLSIAGLVPEGVEHYIEQHALYRPSANLHDNQGDS